MQPRMYTTAVIRGIKIVQEAKYPQTNNQLIAELSCNFPLLTINPNRDIVNNFTTLVQLDAKDVYDPPQRPRTVPPKNPVLVEKEFLAIKAETEGIVFFFKTVLNIPRLKTPATPLSSPNSRIAGV